MGSTGASRRAKGSADLYARIGAFLATHRLSPDPAHYAFAHAVLSAPDSPLAAEVARLTEGRVRLTRQDIERLGGRVMMGADPSGRGRSGRGGDADRHADRIAAETQAVIEGFACIMRAMHTEARSFGHDIGVEAAALIAADPVRGTRELAMIAGGMIERARRNEARLAAATREAEALRAKLDEARQAARRDPLTGLPNRLAFTEAFAARDAGDAPHCLALCDVDQFKRVNDRHGHGVGDRVLHAIAQALGEACEGHLVARHGGEEFAVLLTGVDLADAAALLDAARAGVAARRFRDRDTDAALGPITFSAGVTAIRADEPLDQAIDRADRLLYAAKAQGRDRICAG